MAALVACGFTFVLAPATIWWLRRQQLLDVPNDRSSHALPTPRGAGVAVAAGAVAASVISNHPSASARSGLLVAALAFGAIGLADDVRPTPPQLRLGLQTLAAVAALPWLLRGLSGPWLWQFVFVAGCLVWLVSFVNAFNFMDGINGISASQAMIAGVTWSVVGNIVPARGLGGAGAIIAAAALGFLPFNFPQARVFLGDVGSYFIGAWLAAAAIIGLRAGIAPEAILAPTGLYLADTAITILRRFRAREALHTAHRSHTYQLLTQAGWSHPRTTAFVASVMGLCAVFGLVSLTKSVPARVAADIAIVGILALYVRSPALVTRRKVGPCAG